MAHLDDNSLHTVFPQASDLAVSDVEVIGQLAFLAAEIDLDEDVLERPILDVINRGLWAQTGKPPQPIIPISPLPLDREERVRWLRELVPQLTSAHARDLAYLAAYVVVVIDLELAPVESEFLTDLQLALGIDDDRAAELRDSAVRAITPAE